MVDMSDHAGSRYERLVILTGGDQPTDDMFHLTWPYCSVGHMYVLVLKDESD